ncbi:MAG TPA: class I adenylate-forming enzyme family protein [Acidimicrobiia bacterium]|nr:class I adenylate-forming enzyme family protein [Acidimicrobiia bacterium]
MLTLPEVLHRRAAGDRDRVALDFDDRSFTFGELQSRADEWRVRLAAAGATRGTRVALMSGNRPEFVFAVYGALQIGAAVVMCSPAWKAAEIQHAFTVTSPRLALGDDASCTALSQAVPDATILSLDATGTRAATDEAAPADDPEADAVLVFSSGTTGLPKAVRHTHRSLGHAVEHWITALGLTEHDRFQVATPPVHILGLLNIVTSVAAGTRIRLHRRFDLDAVLRAIAEERMTLEMAVAPIALAMANHPRLEEFDLSSLRYIMWGATPVAQEVAQTVTRRSGVRWLPAYGTSEVPVIAANPVQAPDRWRLDSVGLAVPGVQVRIADPDTGAVLRPGEAGEIETRSPSAMAGYLPDSATAGAFHDGWYRTGDIGWLEPGGWLHITDRLKEMVKVRGFQVAPAEVEAVLHADPRVRDCAVFGVDDPELGEAVVAAVVPVVGATIVPEELRAAVADQLASYKRIRYVVLVDEIPRLPSGKALRRELKERWDVELRAQARDEPLT